MSTLTLESFQKVIDLLYPPLYYGLDKNLERGFFYLVKETEYCPEFLVCHPDDFEAVKSHVKEFRKLVPLKDEPREKVVERLIKTSKLYLEAVYDHDNS